MWMHVDRGRGSQIVLKLCGCHKWMSPNGTKNKNWLAQNNLGKGPVKAVWWKEFVGYVEQISFKPELNQWWNDGWWTEWEWQIMSGALVNQHVLPNALHVCSIYHLHTIWSNAHYLVKCATHFVNCTAHMMNSTRLHITVNGKILNT